MTMADQRERIADYCSRHIERGEKNTWPNLTCLNDSWPIMALLYNLIVAQEEAKVMLTLREFAMISSDVHYECQAKCIEQLVLLVNV